MPTVDPTQPTLSPTKIDWLETVEPTAEPTEMPTGDPFIEGTLVEEGLFFDISGATLIPTTKPTLWPSEFPTNLPTETPPTEFPTEWPTLAPTVVVTGGCLREVAAVCGEVKDKYTQCVACLAANNAVILTRDSPLNNTTMLTKGSPYHRCFRQGCAMA
jgi:hypothetical protein